jgi:hypothetical protein
MLAGVESRFAAHVSRTGAVQGIEPAKVAAAIQANAQALKAFVWQQRMQLQLKGETKKVTLTQMNYDLNGNLQKTLLSEQPSTDSSQPPSGGRRRGRLKQRIVDKKKGEFKEMMEGIASLVKSYTELPHAQLQAALKKAAFTQGQGDMQGAIQIQMSSVLQPGDSLTIWIDQAALLFRKVAVTTTYENNPVTVTANYNMLHSGQVYMAQAILNYPKKQVVVEIDNLNYQPSQGRGHIGDGKFAAGFLSYLPLASKQNPRSFNLSGAAQTMLD